MRRKLTLDVIQANFEVREEGLVPESPNRAGRGCISGIAATSKVKRLIKDLKQGEAVLRGRFQERLGLGHIRSQGSLLLRQQVLGQRIGEVGIEEPSLLVFD